MHALPQMPTAAPGFLTRQQAAEACMDDPRCVSFAPLAHGLLRVAHDVAAGRMF